MKKRFFILFFFALTFVPQSFAEGDGSSLGTESYLSFGLTGGPGGLSFNGTGNYVSKKGFTFGFDLEYSCFLNSFLGFTTGVHINRMSSGYSESNISYSDKGKVLVGNGLTTWNDNARYHLVTDYVKETYKTFMIEVPVLLSMQYRKWYWNLGLKVAVPVSMHVDYSYGESRLYIDEFIGSGTVLDKPMLVASFDGASGTSNLYDKQRHQLLMFYVMATFEVGYTVAFYGGASSLTLGVFGDFSLNNAKLNESASSSIVAVNAREVNYNSLVQTNKVSSVNCYRLGIKLQYHLGIGHGAQRSDRSLRLL